MRLPADATLIVIGAGGAIEGGFAAGPAAANAARVIEAWRAESLPLVHVRPDGTAPGAENATAHRREGEAAIAAEAASAFAGTGLEALLDEIGATTLALCGAAHAVEATARDAGDLGYQAFVVADACWPPDAGGPAFFAHLHGKSASVVDAQATLRAVSTARARQRRDALRRR